MSGQSPRRVAFEVLRAVQVDDAYANLLLPVRIRRAGLTGRDAGFATELTYGAIRMLGRYDAIVEAASGRRVDRIEADVLDVLRIGAHQLLAMRVPVHAAVSETVDLARQVGARRATGFVNAVLRKIAARSDAEWDAAILEGLHGDQRLATRWSHPAWVVGALREALHAEDASDELEDLLAADDVAPRVQLVALPGLAEPGDVLGTAGDVDGEPGDVDGHGSAEPGGAEHGGDAADASPSLQTAALGPTTATVAADASPVSPTGVRGAAGDPARVPAVRDGRARVQDEGSQLAALALTRSSDVRPGERWLDMCAGPGGKAALLAAEARRTGATLVANELVPARAGLVRKALARFDDVVAVQEGDARRFGAPGSADEGARFDRVLLDAPCTGLGALRRRPEARWRKSPDDVPELAALQRELLEAAVRVLAPGGVLAYVTCSPHLDETRRQTERLLAAHGAVLEQLDAAAVVRSVAVRDPGVADGPTAQLWPHRAGTDAMFVALFRRR